MCSFIKGYLTTRIFSMTAQACSLCNVSDFYFGCVLQSVEAATRVSWRECSKTWSSPKISCLHLNRCARHVIYTCTSTWRAFHYTSMWSVVCKQDNSFRLSIYRYMRSVWTTSDSVTSFLIECVCM